MFEFEVRSNRTQNRIGNAEPELSTEREHELRTENPEG